MKIFKLFYFLFFLLFPTLTYASFLDLEKDMKQKFVLESKKIEISGFPYAFNPSIVEWRNSILMCFRVGNDYQTEKDMLSAYSPNRFGLVRLDKDMNPIGKVQLLDIPIQATHYRQQDPRLVIVGNKLFIVYSDMIPGKTLNLMRRMFIAEVQYKDTQFILKNIECLSQFNGEDEKRTEKNWVPFDYNGTLLLAYQINPHIVLYPQLGQGSCETVSSSPGNVLWDWGQLRGGTPALLVKENEYLAFFHSSKKMATVQSNGVAMQHYFMGAYTFSSAPPFTLKKISPEPIIGDNYYSGQPYQTWKPLRVVFPCGYIMNEKYIWISYGRQDHEIWITKLDKKELLKSLVQVPI